MAYPLVTIIGLCFNHSRFLVECLDSISRQTYKNVQVILIDDCSKDDSASKIESWIAANSTGWLFIRHRRNLGLCRSLNEALGFANGKYVSIVATDDVLSPDKLESQVSLFESSLETVGVVYSDAFRMDEEGTELSGTHMQRKGGERAAPEGDVHARLWKENFVPAVTALIRRSCYESVGFYDEDLFFEDWDMWLRISKQYDFAFSNIVAAKYRIVSTSMTNVGAARVYDGCCRVCLKHLAGGWLTPEIRQLALARLAFEARRSYAARSPGHRDNLLAAARLTRNWKLGLLYLFSRFGIR